MRSANARIKYVAVVFFFLSTPEEPRTYTDPCTDPLAIGPTYDRSHEGRLPYLRAPRKKNPLLSQKKPSSLKIQILVQIGRRELGRRGHGPRTIELLQLASATTELLCWFHSCQHGSSPEFRSSLSRQGDIKKTVKATPETP